MQKDKIAYLETASNIIIALTLFLLPVFFLINTTDFFIIPKQLLLIASTLVLLVLWGVRILLERKIVVNTNPVNLPILLFGVIILASSILSRNRFDSLIQTVPVIFALIFFFIMVNNTRTKSAFNIALSSFVLGGAASAVLSIVYFFKFYFLPFPAVANQAFNTLGAEVQGIIYILPVLVFSALYLARATGFPKVKITPEISRDHGFFIQLVALVTTGAGIALALYRIIFLPNKPIILPYIYGFQTAFASISQDAQRFFLSLLFGSGYGTFLTDFTRFKLSSFNLEQNIWNLSFAYSSSFFLELIATTGVLGGLAFIFLIVQVFKSKTAKSSLFVAVVVALILSLILPFAYPSVFMLFSLLGLYIIFLSLDHDKRVYDSSLSLVQAKSGVLSFEATPEGEKDFKKESLLLPVISFVVILIVTGFVGFYTWKFAVSDFKFAESLRQASANNGQKTYELESQAIKTFPYRSDYYRIFSQINLALANSLAAGIQPGTTPSQQIQQNIVTLLQQSIASGRNAVILSPLTSVNWQNLGQIYRALINVGQNADQFAIASENQAIALDPFNPQLYIELGGIYFQLKQWDAAQNQFQSAIQLKRDFANGYYNLGHTLEEKGSLQDALTAYQIVKQLSVKSKANLDKINAEIKALEDKIGEAVKKAKSEKIEPETDQTPLSISTSSAKLPEQKPPVKISPPPSDTKTTPTPEPTSGPTATPTPAE